MSQLGWLTSSVEIETSAVMAEARAASKTPEMNFILIVRVLQETIYDCNEIFLRQWVFICSVSKQKLWRSLKVI